MSNGRTHVGFALRKPLAPHVVEAVEAVRAAVKAYDTAKLRCLANPSRDVSENKAREEKALKALQRADEDLHDTMRDA